jgi:rRNA pseudouridine-1189 N-methylase Emg1 (Nep1/Mra1 family)
MSNKRHRDEVEKDILRTKEEHERMKRRKDNSKQKYELDATYNYDGLHEKKINDGMHFDYDRIHRIVKDK